MAWLLRDDQVLAALELAEERRARMRGLLGRDHVDGALLIRPGKSVHSFGMQFPIDVAFCDRAGIVLRLSTLAPRRVSRPVRRSSLVIEARAGSFERWKLQPGDVVEIKG